MCKCGSGSGSGACVGCGCGCVLVGVWVDGWDVLVEWVDGWDVLVGVCMDGWVGCVGGCVSGCMVGCVGGEDGCWCAWVHGWDVWVGRYRCGRGWALVVCLLEIYIMAKLSSHSYSEPGSIQQ